MLQREKGEITVQLDTTSRLITILSRAICYYGSKHINYSREKESREKYVLLRRNSFSILIQTFSAPLEVKKVTESIFVLLQY